MKHDIPRVVRNGLRRFGLQFSARVILIFGLLLPWLVGFGLPLWPWIVAALVGV